MTEINQITCGDSLEVLNNMTSESVNCVVTSPPYWGLRDYGTAIWENGDISCNHYRDNKVSDKCITGHKNMGSGVNDGIYNIVCKKCGAKRIDKQIGLEETPEKYVAKLVNIFREVKRILTKDGTLWLNLGDTYGGSGNGSWNVENPEHFGKQFYKGIKPSVYLAPPRKQNNVKPKNLCGIPWRVAFALQEDGWNLRMDIIWYKLNPMPESVKDRPTKTHEYIFLLTKSLHYFYDSESIKEIRITKDDKQRIGSLKVKLNDSVKSHSNNCGQVWGHIPLKNKRSVWPIPLQPFKEAHFATFPEKLVLPCIKAGCPEGGIVLDPFCGSGTTCLVAKKLDRKYIGIDLNSEYVEMAKNRIKNECVTIF